MNHAAGSSIIALKRHLREHYPELERPLGLSSLQRSPMKRYPLFSSLFISLSIIPLLGAVADEQRAGIAVTGECLKKIQRDRGAVTVSSSIVAPTAKESSKQTIEAHEKIKAAVQALKLPELLASTSGYSVNQECSYNSKTTARECSGYRTTISTRFETPNLTNLEDIIGVASKLGAQDVSQLEVFVSPLALKAEREGCLEVATRNAQEKAKKIADGAGVTLGKLISVTEGREDNYQAAPHGRAFAMSAAPAEKSAGPSIDAQPYDLQVAVSVVYGIQ